MNKYKNLYKTIRNSNCSNEVKNKMIEAVEQLQYDDYWDQKHDYFK